MAETAIKTTISILASFWILGMCTNFGYVVMLSSAHDLLKSKSHESNETSSVNFGAEGYARECNYLSTGVILLADILPSVIIKTLSPFFALHIHHHLALCIGLTVASFLTVANANNEAVAAIGVALTSLSSGLGESSLLSYTVNYERHTITSWSSGTGAAGILGALAYALLTGVFNLSPSTTMYFMLLVPCLMATTFWILLEHPKKQVLIESSSESVTQGQSLSDKLSYLPKLLKYMLPLGLVYIFEYLINQGLFELIYFENIWLTHAEQYRWYQVLYQLGVFVSRSSVKLVPIKNLWIFSILQGINLMFFLFASLYSFVPNVYIIFVMIVYEGLLGGGSYVHTFHNVMNEVPKEQQEFSMAMTSISDSAGISIAGILAIPLHNYICQIPK